MLIETTQNFGNKEDAEDSLAGIKTLPGFLFGYVKTPNQPGGTFDLVHVFDCSGDTQNLRKQRLIKHLTFGDIESGWSANEQETAAPAEPTRTATWNHERAGLG
jgi:hypothetical protein